MSTGHGEAWVEVQAREKPAPPVEVKKRESTEKARSQAPQLAQHHDQETDKQDRPVKSDGNASFLRAARAGNLEKVLEYLKGSTDINTSNANGLNALHLAAKEGHVHIVTELLKRGAKYDEATKKGNTALHIASLAGQEEIVKILVQKGAKVNVQSQNGFTPLYMAAQENHAEVVQFLLDSGASQSVATDDGFTPLAVALQQGHDKVVAVLLENDSRGRVKLPALHIAAKKDDVKAATLLLQNEHNVDGTSKSGFTPLHIASHYGNTNVGQLLVQKGADINFKARNNITPMHVASKWGRTNMVTLLLDSNAEKDCKTRDGLTPLHCAARSGHDQVVDLLLERGAPVGSKTKNGLSPLHMAAQGDHVDCARHLLEHQAPINDVTVDYLTPLHVAAHCGNVRTAKLLLDRKCEVNARALNGFTPLHIACKKNRIKVVELLLKYGGNIEATTESGLTPLHVAAFMGHMNIVIYLIQHGANPDFATVRGETALHLAARANQTDIIRILLRNNATVDAKAREQQTPLHIAARLGNVDNVALLLQHGANPDATTKDLYTPLHIAAKEGHEEVCAVLLEHKASLNLTTKKGFTPLHIAAKYGQIKVARLLLQKGADPDIQGANGLTPLHVATHYNNVNVALLLLEHKASPHVTAKNGYTPLHIAAKKNQMDIATTLLEFGAKPNAESKSGFTPLHLASQEGHTDMVSLLLERGAEVNCRAKNGLTPMHLAAQEDKVPVAEVLVKHGSEIDPQTKAGYTPLHTACHFGQINMIRFLLEHGANVNATTKLGYTPLHQAAQQGHVLVINLLLKYKADPNKMSNNGQTPLSIAQRLGYISVVEILKTITEVQAQPSPGTEEKYKVVSPETMQETLMTDSEDEGGDDDFVMPQSPIFGRPLSEQHVYLPYYDGSRYQDRDDTILNDRSYLSAEDMKFLADDSISPARGHDSTMNTSDYDMGTHEVDFMESKEERLEASRVSAVHAGRAPGEDQQYSSYSGMSFSSSFDPDNVAVDRQPLFSGFLVSFMVDARGGAMRGCRHSGVRIIIPPGHTSMPTRVTCKLVKKEKLIHPPPLMEGEALASRILEMGPANAKFLGPVVIEVPHFASLRDKEREIVILRSDNGESWREHTLEATDSAIHDALHGSFEGDDADLESAEDVYKTRIARILTTDFPQYFAIVTRIRQETCSIGTDGGMISSTVVPQVQAVFPDGALTKKIKVGLQAQPVKPELVSKMLGNRVAVSPIVTVEPRRRKFHKPITLTIPVPKASQKGMINQYGGDTPTLRLLCSITGGTAPAQWEDITGTTPLKFINDCVSFTTTVSARFWLMDCQNINEAAKMASELYREAVAVPFMSKFVVFARQQDYQESNLRVFCMTDDKMDKTLESQEHFTEIARSRDVEVLDGKPQYVEMAGNLVPVTKSGEQLYVNFNAFRENRLPFNVRIRDTNQEPMGRIAFMKEAKQSRDQPPQTPICNLNIKVPTGGKGDAAADLDSDTAAELRQQYDILRSGVPAKEQISRAELRLTDIADQLQGDWVPLARELKFSEEEITTIQTEYPYVSEQALVMLQMWVDKNKEKATGNELERALRRIGREDVIDKCMRNVEDVEDAVERAVAKVHIDQAGFDAFKEELGPSRGSSIPRGLSLDVSYDEHDLAKDAEIPEQDRREKEEDVVVATVDERRGVVKSLTPEQEEESRRAKQDAYLELAKQLEESGDVELVLEQPEEGTNEVIEDTVTKVTTDKTKSAPMFDQTQTFEEWAEQKPAEYELPDEPAQADKATFEDWVEKAKLDDSAGRMPEPEVVTEVTKGDVETRSNVDESTMTIENGTSVRRRVVTTEHVQPEIIRTKRDGVVVEEKMNLVLIGSEVEEEVTEVPPGADPDDLSNAETSIDEWEESLPDGTWQKHRIVRTRFVPPSPDAAPGKLDEVVVPELESPQRIPAPEGEYASELTEGLVQESVTSEVEVSRAAPPEEVTQVTDQAAYEEWKEELEGAQLERDEVAAPKDQLPGETPPVAVDQQQEVIVVDTSAQLQAPHELAYGDQTVEKPISPEVMPVPSPEYPQDLIEEYSEEILEKTDMDIKQQSPVPEPESQMGVIEAEEVVERTDIDLKPESQIAEPPTEVEPEKTEVIEEAKELEKVEVDVTPQSPVTVSQTELEIEATKAQEIVFEKQEPKEADTDIRPQSPVAEPPTDFDIEPVSAKEIVVEETHEVKGFDLGTEVIPQEPLSPKDENVAVDRVEETYLESEEILDESLVDGQEPMGETFDVEEEPVEEKPVVVDETDVGIIREEFKSVETEEKVVAKEEELAKPKEICFVKEEEPTKQDDICLVREEETVKEVVEENVKVTTPLEDKEIPIEDAVAAEVSEVLDEQAKLPAAVSPTELEIEVAEAQEIMVEKQETKEIDTDLRPQSPIAEPPTDFDIEPVSAKEIVVEDTHEVKGFDIGTEVIPQEPLSSKDENVAVDRVEQTYLESEEILDESLVDGQEPMGETFDVEEEPVEEEPVVVDETDVGIIREEFKSVRTEEKVVAKEEELAKPEEICFVKEEEPTKQDDICLVREEETAKEVVEEKVKVTTPLEDKEIPIEDAVAAEMREVLDEQAKLPAAVSPTELEIEVAEAQEIMVEKQEKEEIDTDLRPQSPIAEPPTDFDIEPVSAKEIVVEDTHEVKGFDIGTEVIPQEPLSPKDENVAVDRVEQTYLESEEILDESLADGQEPMGKILDEGEQPVEEKPVVIDETDVGIIREEFKSVETEEKVVAKEEELAKPEDICFVKEEEPTKPDDICLVREEETVKEGVEEKAEVTTPLEDKDMPIKEAVATEVRELLEEQAKVTTPPEDKEMPLEETVATEVKEEKRVSTLERGQVLVTSEMSEISQEWRETLPPEEEEEPASPRAAISFEGDKIVGLDLGEGRIAEEMATGVIATDEIVSESPQDALPPSDVDKETEIAKREMVESEQTLVGVDRGYDMLVDTTVVEEQLQKGAVPPCDIDKETKIVEKEIVESEQTLVNVDKGDDLLVDAPVAEEHLRETEPPAELEEPVAERPSLEMDIGTELDKEITPEDIEVTQALEEEMRMATEDIPVGPSEPELELEQIVSEVLTEDIAATATSPTAELIAPEEFRPLRVDTDIATERVEEVTSPITTPEEEPALSPEELAKLATERTESVVVVAGGEPTPVSPVDIIGSPVDTTQVDRVQEVADSKVLSSVGSSYDDLRDIEDFSKIPQQDIVVKTVETQQAQEHIPQDIQTTTETELESVPPETEPPWPEELDLSERVVKEMDIPDNGRVVETEQTLPDGSVKRKRIVIMQADQYIIKTITTYMPDGQVIRETVTEPLDSPVDLTNIAEEQLLESIEQVPAPTESVIERPVAYIPQDLETDRQTPQELDLSERIVNEMDMPDGGKVIDTEQTLPDRTVIKRRIVIVQADRSIIKAITTYMPDGEVKRETITESLTGTPLDYKTFPETEQLESLAHIPAQTGVALEATAPGETDLDQAAELIRSTEEPEDIPETTEPEDVDEFQETLPDGTVVTRRIITRRFDTIITRTIITIYPDGRTVEETLTEEVEPDEAPTAGSEAPVSPVDKMEPTETVLQKSPQEELAPAEMTVDVEQPDEDVEEVEETLPDGTVIRKRIIRKRIKVIKKKIRKIGPDGEVTEEVVTEEVPVDADTEALALQGTPDDYTEDHEALAPGGIRVFTDTIKGEPVTDTDVQEFEETLPDGTIVKRRVVKTRQKQMVVKRFVMEGPEGELPATDEEAHHIIAKQAPGQLDPQMKLYIDRVEGEPEDTSNVEEFEETLPDGTVVKRRVVTTRQQQMITEHKLVDGSELPELAAMIPPHSADDQVVAESAAQIQASPDAGAEGGDDLQETKVVLKKQIHKKTIVRDGQEETVVTEDTHVEQDNEGPEELRDSMQKIIDEFMDGKQAEESKHTEV